MSVGIGDTAPDFTLRNQFGEEITLSSFRGRRSVLLMFYPFAFSGTCSGELCALRDRYADFENDDVVVLSVSCDSIFALKAFAEHDRLTHSLLSDFWPHGQVSTAYGVFIEAKGIANRASFVIDKEGTVRWSVITSIREARSADDYAAALADLG